MLTIRRKGNASCPIITCDECGSEIEDASDGNYQWQEDETGSEIGPLTFSHKRCFARWETTHPGLWMTMELEVLPVFLTNNLNIQYREAEAKAAYFSE